MSFVDEGTHTDTQTEHENEISSDSIHIEMPDQEVNGQSSTGGNNATGKFNN